MSEVILIFPKTTDTKSYRPGLGPPLGVLTLAGVLMEHGISVKIIDQRIDLHWKDTLKNEMKETPMFIGISSISGTQIKYGLEISHFIKTHWDVPVIWGGVHPILEPISTVQHELVDITVIGEGEKTIIELVDYFRGRKKLQEVKGIAFKRNNEVVLTAPQKVVDLNSLPFVPFFLVDLKQYKKDRTFFGFKEYIHIPLETSRGCSHQCTFCRESMQTFPWRAMSPQRVVEHIEKNINEYGIRSFVFVDDNFCVNRNRVDNILDLLAEKNISIEWYTNMMPEYLLRSDLPLLCKLEKSGCRSITIGLESGSDKILKKLGKRITVGELLKMNRLIAKTGIRVLYTTIFGFPYDTVGTIKQTCQLVIRVLLENPHAVVGITRLIPVPRTRVLMDCAKRGFLVPKTLEEWSKIDTRRLVDYSQWMNKAACQYMNNLDYFCAFITITRGKPSLIGRFLFKIYARILLLRFEYDYFGLWLEPKIFSAFLMLRYKIMAIFRSRDKCEAFY